VSGPAPARLLRRVQGRAASFLSEHGVDTLNIVSLVGLATAVFLLKLEPIGIGGDAIRKWFFVRQWFHADDFAGAKWDHHMARLGVNGLAYLAQLVFGHEGRAYYVAPVSAGVLQVVFVYLCGKRLGGRMVGVVSAFLLIAFPPEHMAASQLLPEVFSGAYAIAGAYFFLRYADETSARRRRVFLVGSSLCLFAGYLAKETTVFYLPGFAVAIWMVAPGTRIKDLILFFAVFAVGVAGETAFYNVFTNYAHRLAVVRATHLTDGPASETNFWGLFGRYEQADPMWRFAFYVLCGAALGVIAFAGDVRATAIVVMATSYFFFLTFLVRSVNPIVIWQAFRSRYLDQATPFALLVIGLFCTLAGREIFRRHTSPVWDGRVARLARHAGFVTLGVSVLAAYICYRTVDLEENPLVTIPKMSVLVKNTYQRNLPVVGARDQNGLWAAYALLLPDRLIMREGKLPTYDDVKRNGETKRYFVRYPSVYTADRLRRIIKRHCYIEAVGRDGHFFVRRMQFLPQECDEELAQ
jgi:hypothetical protein